MSINMSDWLPTYLLRGRHVRAFNELKNSRLRLPLWKKNGPSLRSPTTLFKEKTTWTETSLTERNRKIVRNKHVQIFTADNLNKNIKYQSLICTLFVEKCSTSPKLAEKPVSAVTGFRDELPFFWWNKAALKEAVDDFEWETSYFLRAFFITGHIERIDRDRVSATCECSRFFCDKPFF